MLSTSDKKIKLDNFEFEIPEFPSDEEFEAWWASLAKVEIDFDERLGERKEVLLTLNQRIFDGYGKLAKESGSRLGEDLMKIVLSRYMRNHLPEDF